jgi:hypothetical protein
MLLSHCGTPPLATSPWKCAFPLGIDTTLPLGGHGSILLLLEEGMLVWAAWGQRMTRVEPDLG